MDNESDSVDGQSGVSLSSLTKMLNVRVPTTRAYLFHGQQGTFVIKKDRRDPIDRITEEE